MNIEVNLGDIFSKGVHTHPQLNLINWGRSPIYLGSVLTLATNLALLTPKD